MSRVRTGAGLDSDSTRRHFPSLSQTASTIGGRCGRRRQSPACIHMPARASESPESPPHKDLLTRLAHGEEENREAAGVTDATHRRE